MSGDVLKDSKNLASEESFCMYFNNILGTGWLTLLMLTTLEAKVMLQDDRYVLFSFTVDLLKIICD